MKRAIISAFAFATAVVCQTVPGNPSTGDAGTRIMSRVNARPRGKSSLNHLEMIIHDPRRGDFHKTIVMQREQLASGYRTIYQITSPVHEKGIGLLISEDASQRGIWMYFPAAKQSVRVASRGFPALASDFICEDLSAGVPLNEYDFRILGLDRIDGHDAIMIEMKPRTENLRGELGYTKAIGWVRKDPPIIVRADYYDERNVVFKSFHASAIEQKQGIWTIGKMEMENLRAHHSSEVRVLDTDYSVHFPDDAFTPNRMGSGVAPPT